jgi:putative transposase
MARILGRKGEKVQYGGEEMKVRSVQDLNTLILIDTSGDHHHALLSDLEKEARGIPRKVITHDDIRASKVDPWVKACKHLLDDQKHTKAEVELAARKLGVSVASVYRALERWRLSGETKDIPPPTRPGGRGKSRLLPAIEAIIQEHLDRVLKKGGISKRKFLKDCRRAIDKAGFEVSPGTLRDRIASVPSYRMMKTRKGRDSVARELDPLQGSYPNLSRPLQVVQIDHWKIDMEVVSDDRTRSVGRAWATIGICIYSRMIFGLNIGFDDPGNVPFGMMMINGMLSKNRVADDLDLQWDNPIRGRPEVIEMDNAKEFTGKMAQLACANFGIHLKIRPVRKPHYGQYIERFNGTLAERFKDLPGATGANVVERQDKNPEKTAALTLSELTKLFWMMIDEYQNEVHTTIGMTPLEKYSGYFFGPNGQKHRPPETFVDDLDLRLNWYPVTYRTVQRYGIRVEHLDYYSEALEWLVRNRRDFGKVEIRQNPFDVRVIYVKHPDPRTEAGGIDKLDSADVRAPDWIPVTVRQIGFPEASLFELRKAAKEALARKREPTPDLLGSLIEEQQRLVDNAVKLTKEAQRRAARQEHHRKENLKAKKAEERSGSSKPIGQTAGPAPEPVKPASDANELSSIIAGISDADLEELVE